MTDALRDLADSTRQFYERFNVQPKLHPDALQNFREEVREFIEAAEIGENRDHIAEEAADVFVTALGMCFASGVEIDQLIQQIYTVIAKNNAKTHATHVYEDGKIRRRK